MAWSAPLMKAKGEEPTPAPPTKFRCNRARMMLSIRVTLHHIAAAQINLTTTPTTIKLDTLKARRKFKLHRVYPRGVECDDTQTTAKMEGEMLVVEMPITKLPPIGEIEPAPAIPVQPAAKGARDAEQPAKKRKRSIDAAADDMAESCAAIAPPKKPKKAAASESASGSGGAGSDSQGGAAPSNERMQQLLEDAARTADRRREQSLGKMHRFQQSEEEQNRKAAERQQEREQQKQKLLNTFRKQQAASRAEKHAEQKKNKARKASDATLASTPVASAPKKKRVSFSSDAVESGKSR